MTSKISEESAYLNEKKRKKYIEPQQHIQHFNTNNAIYNINLLLRSSVIIMEEGLPVSNSHKLSRALSSTQFKEAPPPLPSPNTTTPPHRLFLARGWLVGWLADWLPLRSPLPLPDVSTLAMQGPLADFTHNMFWCSYHCKATFFST